MDRSMTVLAIPGLGLDEESWVSTLSAAKDTPAVVRLLPGYGEPAPHGQGLQPQRLAALLRNDLPDRRLVVLGHSASCQVAAHLAVMAPARVAALVLVGPTTDPRAATWPRLAARWLATAAHEKPWQGRALARQYHRTTLRTMSRAMEAARHDSILATLGQAHVPVLVVRGRHDHICPPDWAQEVAACGTAGSRAVTLRTGAHMVPLTHGRLVAAAVDDFAADVAGRLADEPPSGQP